MEAPRAMILSGTLSELAVANTVDGVADGVVDLEDVDVELVDVDVGSVVAVEESTLIAVAFVLVPSGVVDADDVISTNCSPDLAPFDATLVWIVPVAASAEFQTLVPQPRTVKTAMAFFVRRNAHREAVAGSSEPFSRLSNAIDSTIALAPELRRTSDDETTSFSKTWGDP
ncbi:hypothetical protein M426DRAFT_135519 [Hypoxylon sp. CI-4A]|nr:hypothetical protein M426DRAFT_135519 [Hypoxylon sp. CI-4A]